MSAKQIPDEALGSPFTVINMETASMSKGSECTHVFAKIGRLSRFRVSWPCRANASLGAQAEKECEMSTILIVILLIVLLGGGGGYYGYRRHGGAGLGGALGVVLLVLVVLWLVGGLHLNGV
jgi:hypothetical protein